MLYIPLSASEKSVYFLLHGLYSSSYHWNHLITSDDFQRSEFNFAGNFRVNEDLFSQDKFVVTPEFPQKISELLEKDNQVFTINFASGFQHDFLQQARQIRQVLDLFPPSGYRYYLLGHSMGGLAARAYLTQEKNRRIAGLITIGTPNLGSYLGNSDTSITALLGIMAGVFTRPDNLITGISRIWKEGRRNVTPALAPGSPELSELNSHDFPEETKCLCLFSTINTREEINSLSRDEQFVHQILQMEKLKSFQSINPKDKEITTLYNDLYYNDGLVSIASQNLINAIPNSYQVEVHHIPTRVYHDNEPKDIDHLLAAMRIIKEEKKRTPKNLFIYSTSKNVLQEDYFYSISKSFFASQSYDATLVVDEKDSLSIVSNGGSLPLYDYGIFLISKTNKLQEVSTKIDSSWIFPIIIDFSLNNNISMFANKECIYIKIVSVEEAESFFRLLGDVLSARVHVKRGELEKVQEQIIRYYFTSSNMTERLKIPYYWWEANLSFFQ